MTDADLNELAEQLRKQSDELATKARQASHRADVLEGEPESKAVLDPDFAENLQKSLAEPRQRLRDIAKLTR
jgi:bacterioferritin (cytochrome b1)